MTISISNLTVSTNAPMGTVIGSLQLNDDTGASIVADFMSAKGAAGFFGITGNNLVTLSASIPPGYYSVRIHGNGQNVSLSGKADFVITVTAT